jgi:hypothetical protein
MLEAAFGSSSSQRTLSWRVSLEAVPGCPRLSLGAQSYRGILPPRRGGPHPELYNLKYERDADH